MIRLVLLLSDQNFSVATFLVDQNKLSVISIRLDSSTLSNAKAGHIRPLFRHFVLRSGLLRSCVRSLVPLSRDSPEPDRQPLFVPPLKFAQEHFPQVSVLDIRMATRLPVVPSPCPRPLCRPLHDVLRVCGNGKGLEAFTNPVPET